MSVTRKKRRYLGVPPLYLVITCIVILLAGGAWAGFRVWANSTSTRPTESAASAGNSSSATASAPSAVCGQSALRSPFTYDGAAGAYHSGMAGLPTYGAPNTNFPKATAGVVLPAGVHDYPSYNLRPDTVYYLQPGLHVSGIEADAGDAFVGGYHDGQSSVLSGEYKESAAIDSNPTNGDQPDVVIEFLTVEKYLPDANAAAINQDSNTGWIIKNNLITLNAPGAGAILGTGNVLENSCLTLNGQYGFQSVATNSWGKDKRTAGPRDIRVQGNEISYNDTCDFEGKVSSPATGSNNSVLNPVPPANRNGHCGTVTPDGDQGGFKLWQTDDVTVAANYIHNNYGPGAWVDTDNANTTFTGNRITGNDDEAITEEASYNFAITNNYMADNDWVGGLANPGFPQPAVYISESGSDRDFEGVPGEYSAQSVISGNTMVNNGGGVFLWQNSNRFCSDGSDGVCTLVGHGAAGPFTIPACHANLPAARLSTTTFAGSMTGSPLEDWWDGCIWRTENVLITNNVIDFNPAAIKDCTASLWPDCGANGMFSEYGSPPDNEPGWVIPSDITFFQGNTWTKNVYDGPSTFFAWNQGNGDNPVGWAFWTGAISEGDKCASAGEHQSGYCMGPFGQDAGSTYSPDANS